MNRKTTYIDATMIFILVISLAACFERINNSAAVELQKTGNVVLPIHSSIDLDDAYTLSFDRVSEDSRCPVDVVCVWAGNAKIHLTLTGPGGDTQTPNAMPIEINTSNPVAHEILGWRFEWLELLPSPYSDQMLDSNAYRIKMNITRIAE
ncbi:hypothetical protein HUU42_02800 [bacterium]|nr:hypothetical protein [bacterium]